MSAPPSSRCVAQVWRNRCAPPLRPVLAGKGYWAHMLTFGGTWYPDPEKTWAVSLLNRYEFNHEQQKTQTTPGQSLTMEWGLSKSIRKTIDVGLIGYYQQQTTKDRGPAAVPKDSVVALGPEISVFCPKLGLFTSLRYAREFEAKNRSEGNTFALTFTKRW